MTSRARTATESPAALGATVREVSEQLPTYSPGSRVRICINGVAHVGVVHCVKNYGSGWVFDVTIVDRDGVPDLIVDAPLARLSRYTAVE